jgi:UDP-2,3-diacylglucosamine hydrolase
LAHHWSSSISPGLRTCQSEQARQNLVADVDAEEARRWLTRAGAQTLVHGHTHRAGRQFWARRHGTTLVREVLSDWDRPLSRAPKC